MFGPECSGWGWNRAIDHQKNTESSEVDWLEDNDAEKSLKSGLSRAAFSKSMQ